MKLRNKLILSCAALAAVATTAVSSTFAWYTSNTEVTAKGITGKTKTSADTTLLISKTGAQKSWGATVDLEFEVSELGSLIPVAYQAADEYVKATDVTESNYNDKKASLYVVGTGSTPYEAAPAAWAANTDYYYLSAKGYHSWDKNNSTINLAKVNDTSVASTGKYAGDYLSFMLYFKSGSTDSLNVGLQKFTLANKTDVDGDLPGKTTLTNTGLAGVATSTYTVDILRALTVVTEAGASTEVESGYAAQATAGSYNEVAVATGKSVVGLYTKSGDTYAPASGTAADGTKYYAASLTRTPYNVEAFKKDNDSLDSATSFNAHQYYDAIKGTNIAALSKTNSETLTTFPGHSADGTLNSLQSLGYTGAGATGSTDPILAVRFDIYLDGWDVACFDACQGQIFTLSMEFGVIQ